MTDKVYKILLTIMNTVVITIGVSTVLFAVLFVGFLIIKIISWR